MWGAVELCHYLPAPTSAQFQLHAYHNALMQLHARPLITSLGQRLGQNARRWTPERALVTVKQPIATFHASPHRHDTASSAIPLRKQLKDEAKQRKKSAKATKSGHKTDAVNVALESWELTVGIEVHAELNTIHKLFSSAATSETAEPNTHVARFDAALPGAQPGFQRATLIPALRAALAMKCEIQRRSSWDRKHYFYQDQPNGYQITQYYGVYQNYCYMRKTN